MSALAALIRARHAQARIVDDGDSLQAVLQVGGGWHSVRVRTAPLPEIYVGLPALDGFVMTVEDTLTGWPWSHGDVSFDRRYRVTTNDPALALAWLDDETRRAIVSLRYRGTVSSPWRGLPTLVAPPVVERGWRFELAGTELAVLKGAPEGDLERVHDAMIAGAAVAARGQRLAAAWHRLAATLEATTTTDRWDIGGDFALTGERGGVAVRVCCMRRRSDEPSDQHHVRTLVAAPRVTPHDDALVVWRRGAPGEPRRSARKLTPLALPGLGGHGARASDLALAESRLDSAARSLIVDCGLDALELDAQQVAAWLDGVVDDAPRLAAAIELCARLAIDGGAGDGPYR